MIIDVRCRPPIPELGSYFLETCQGIHHGYGANKVFDNPTMETFFEELGEYGITTAAAPYGNNPGTRIGRHVLPSRTASNDVMAELQRKYWGRFIGVMGIDAGNVFHSALIEIERCYQLGLQVVFIEPGRSPGCNLDDRQLYPIYEKCVELDLTLIPQTTGNLGGKNIDYGNPRHLDQVATDFPELRIIAGHACYPYGRQAIVVGGRHENVYLSPDETLARLGTEDWVKAVNMNLHDCQNKFLFGSAYPCHPMKRYMEAFFELPWKPEALPKMMYKNALRALKLEDDPVFKEMYPS
ncbi:MAG: hypothetical protein A3F74_23425 [Betaproteobacteria bacterium RIFCSPLOWO2_12_FULL_62_58]|nr:MAG: hypothetical protein A3F74_23425 [Betaproteobacteria bacterium RIFCSPLOWO2_12_FULL_62_58]